MITPPPLTPHFLRQLFDYNPKAGVLIWKPRGRHLFRAERDMKRWNTRYAGRPAFSPNSKGYLDGMIFRKMHRAHVVAWAVHYGAWPHSDLDHINGKRDDNRIENLRAVTRSINCRNTKMRTNNTSGVIGVCPHRGRPGSWRAAIRIDGKQVHLGVFATLEAAAGARRQAEAANGYHPNHGRAR